MAPSNPVRIVDADGNPISDDNPLAVDAQVNVDNVNIGEGLATEAKQDTAITALQAIETAVELIDNAIDDTEMQVDVVSSALPDGAATETTLAAVQTAVETLDNVVSGSEMQVDVVGALPAGDNNIGNVDVASVAIPGTFYHGQTTVTTAGTEVVLAASQALLSGVTVKALAGNAGLVYVGGNPVTSSTGFELAAGEQVFIETDNLSDVFVDAAENGDGVCWSAS